jgi:hypothetical protein
VKRPLALPVLLSLGLYAACGPSEDQGPINRLYLDDGPSDAGRAGNGATGGKSGVGGEAGAPAMVPPEPPGPPSVSEMTPLSGAYGSLITIQGEWLGSAQREGVKLLIGADGQRELSPSSKPEIASWSESAITFRFPFPLEGKVVVETPEGTIEAGSFEPTYVPGPPLEAAEEVTSYGSIAHAPGVLSAIIATGTARLVSFDGEEWIDTTVSGTNLRRESLRLYAESNTLRAFGLSTATSPTIIELDPTDELSQASSGVKVTSDYVVAGGVDGATLWSRSTNAWTRYRPQDGVWTQDKGPIADPNPNGPDHVAGATSDGALYIGWSEDTGSITDDRGAPAHRFLAPTASAFAAKLRTGNEMDDEISSFTLSDRGRGLVATYCGTDEDPFNLSGNNYLCFAALLPATAKATLRETSSLRYGFGAESQVAAYCSASLGLRLLPAVGAGSTQASALDKIGGDVIAWPCPRVVAIEVDPDGEPLVLLEQEGKLYSPRPRAL